MTYCMADIHGNWAKYRAMLSQINFSENDTLYIIGDAIDRGEDGVEILLDIMKRPNVHLILGNHEEMLLQSLGPNNELSAKKLWISNGGMCTKLDLLWNRDKETKDKLINYLLDCPDHLEIQVGDARFHLVHGYPGDDRYHRLWSRPNVNSPQPIHGVTTIVGHTPTIYYMEETTPMTIWKKNGIIDIDCGCGHKSPYSRLACLRLDDMHEFYI